MGRVKKRTMIVGLIISFAIAAYATVSYRQFQKLAAVGIKLGAKSVPFSQNRPGALLRILVAGDSTGVGQGAVDPRDSTAGDFAKEYPDAEIVNLSRSGRRLNEMLTVFKEQKPTLGKFDVIVFQIGANDITHFTKLTSVETDLAELLKEAREIAPKIIVLHCGDLGKSPIFPWPVNWIITARTRQVRQIYLRVVPPVGAHYVDLYKLRVNDEFATNPKRFYAEDYFHLSGDGYGVWYREIRKVLDAIIR